ncbi:hypothetical protein, partial [Peribacillus frigoritolerans]|uniref:hypothetical protein n=1 Tax=Peribacillus frigoritolerans TaxID=450367 RepID=UPI0039A339A2
MFDITKAITASYQKAKTAAEEIKQSPKEFYQNTKSDLFVKVFSSPEKYQQKNEYMKQVLQNPSLMPQYKTDQLMDRIDTTIKFGSPVLFSSLGIDIGTPLQGTGLTDALKENALQSKHFLQYSPLGTKVTNFVQNIYQWSSQNKSLEDRQKAFEKFEKEFNTRQETLERYKCRSHPKEIESINEQNFVPPNEPDEFDQLAEYEQGMSEEEDSESEPEETLEEDSESEPEETPEEELESESEETPEEEPESEPEETPEEDSESESEETPEEELESESEETPEEEPESEPE